MTRPGEQARTLGYGTCTGKTYETSQSSSSNEQEPLAMILSGEDIPPLVISILGIQLNQRRDELTHLVPEIYRVEELGADLEAWHLSLSARDKWPYSVRFVDGIVCRVIGKGLSVDKRAFSRTSPRKELLSALPDLQRAWNGGLSLETKKGRDELTVSFSPAGNEYILENKDLLRIWSERLHAMEDGLTHESDS